MKKLSINNIFRTCRSSIPIDSNMDSCFFLDTMLVLFQKKSLGKRRHLMSGAVTRREFSVRYVWNGARAWLRWNSTLPYATL